jgi:hypothetical protein
MWSLGAWGRTVPIRRLIEPGVFAPEVVAMMGEVFEDVLKTLGLVNREDAATKLVAYRIIELVQSGEHDPKRLKQLALEAVKGHGPAST